VPTLFGKTNFPVNPKGTDIFGHMGKGRKKLTGPVGNRLLHQIYSEFREKKREAELPGGRTKLRTIKKLQLWGGAHLVRKTGGAVFDLLLQGFYRFGMYTR